jgi:ferredoxin like protein
VTFKVPSVSDRLGKNQFVTDEEETHIEIDNSICTSQCPEKWCVLACPAQVYAIQPDGTTIAEAAACLECATCLQVCTPGGLKWFYPRGGFGVSFREG